MYGDGKEHAPSQRGAARTSHSSRDQRWIDASLQLLQPHLESSVLQDWNDQTTIIVTTQPPNFDIVVHSN
jgi:hypothetical protein